jgi:hypothetical protein
VADLTPERIEEAANDLLDVIEDSYMTQEQRERARKALALLSESSEREKALREAVKHVVNDSPGTPTSVKVYLERALYPEERRRREHSARTPYR